MTGKLMTAKAARVETEKSVARVKQERDAQMLTVETKQHEEREAWLAKARRWAKKEAPVRLQVIAEMINKLVQNPTGGGSGVQYKICRMENTPEVSEELLAEELCKILRREGYTVEAKALGSGYFYGLDISW